MLDPKNIDQIIDYDFEKNEHKLRENNMYLTDYQVEVLNNYDIHYQNYPDMNSLLFAIEDLLSSSYDELPVLSLIADQISEFNYYHFTNK